MLGLFIPETNDRNNEIARACVAYYKHKGQVAEDRKIELERAIDEHKILHKKNDVPPVTVKTRPNKQQKVEDKKTDDKAENKTDQPKQQQEKVEVANKVEVVDKNGKTIATVEAKKEDDQQQVTPVVESASSGEAVVAEAAHSEMGFNPMNFVQQPQQQATAVPNPAGNFVQQPAQQQTVVNPVVGVNQQPQQIKRIEEMFPEYAAADQSTKCDIINKYIAATGVNAPYDYFQNLNTDQKIYKLRNHITFDHQHKGIDIIQINSLLSLINSPLLRNKMTEYGSVDRVRDPKLFEVPAEKYGTPGQFDMTFEVRLKDKKSIMVVQYNTVPVYNTTTKSWNSDIRIFKCKIKKPAMVKNNQKEAETTEAPVEQQAAEVVTTDNK